MTSPSDDLHRDWILRRSARPYSRGVAMTDAGVILGASRLVAEPVGSLLGDNPSGSARVLALLTVAAGKPPRADFVAQIDAASRHWQRGDKALANLRLVFAGLPRLADESDGYRLFLAETALDGGLPPDDLMKLLDLDADGLGRTYNPNQPRVPAGSGAASGRWTHASGAPPAADEAVHQQSTKPPETKPPTPPSPASVHLPKGPPLQHAADAPAGGAPKLCDDPVLDRKGGRKDFDLRYQEFVGFIANPDKPIVPATKAYSFFNPVTGASVLVDQCRDSDGAVIEAKGHYAEMLETPWGKNKLEDEWVKQATRQVQAAQANGDRPVEWWFYEHEAADFATELFAKNKALENITIRQLDYPGEGDWPYPPSATWAPRKDMR